MFPSFVPDKARPLAARPYLVPSIYLVCLAGSLLPQGRLRATSVTLLVCSLISQIPKYTTGDVAQDALLPVQATLVFLQFLDHFVLNSENDFSRVKDAGKTPRTWREKLRRNVALFMTMRGIGWNWKVKNVPEGPSPQTAKWEFVRTELLKTGLFYILFDACQCMVLNSTYNSAYPPDLLSDSIPRQIISGLFPGASSYYSLNMTYTLPAALSVAAGIYSPSDWPPLMGKLRDVVTVRDIWGKFWHQLLRRRLNLPFNLLKRYVDIPKGTFLSKYLQLYLAFGVSALIHNLSCFNMPLNDNGINSGTYQFSFFILQPFVITFEDLVIHLGKRAGVKASWKTKLLGRVWTFAWMTYSLRFAAVAFTGWGVGRKSPIPSLINAILRMTGTAFGKQGVPEL